MLKNRKMIRYGRGLDGGQTLEMCNCRNSTLCQARGAIRLGTGTRIRGDDWKNQKMATTFVLRGFRDAENQIITKQQYQRVTRVPLTGHLPCPPSLEMTQPSLLSIRAGHNIQNENLPGGALLDPMPLHNEALGQTQSFRVAGRPSRGLPWKTPGLRIAHCAIRGPTKGKGSQFSPVWMRRKRR